LEGAQSRHEYYREETVKYMKKQPDNFKPFVFTGWDKVCTYVWIRVCIYVCVCVCMCVCMCMYILYMCVCVCVCVYPIVFFFTNFQHTHTHIHTHTHTHIHTHTHTHQKYLKEMDKLGEWGGNLELAAVCRRFKTHITVHRYKEARLDVRNPDKKCRTIHIAYVCVMCVVIIIIIIIKMI